MSTRQLKTYSYLVLGLGLFVVLLGVSLAYAVPYAAAEGLEEAIRGAHGGDEVRSRIAQYYESASTIRLVLVGLPGVMIALLAVLCIRRINRLEEEIGGTSGHDQRH